MSSSYSPVQLHSDSKSVLIVILNWNSPKETLDAVESVLGMDYPSYRVAIIDNGSTDKSIEALSRIADSRVELIRLPENLGYTGGCNIGMQKAIDEGMDYVWLLNSDSVTQAGTLSSLVKVAEADSRIGMVSPLIASMQRQAIYIYAGGYFNAKMPNCETTRDAQIGARWAEEHRDSILLLGTALLVRTEMARRIGLFDAKMFAYWEDMDLSMRSNGAGFRNAVDFSSTVYHSEKFPTDNPEEIRPHFWYYNARNEIRFWKKHAGFFARLRPLWWAYRLQLGHLNLVKGSEASRQAILAGMWDGWTNKTGAYSANASMPGVIAWAIELQRPKQ